MRIVFISNVITPHQIPLCDELSVLSNVDFYFLESVNIDKNTLPIGWRVSCNRNYIITYDQLTASLNEYKEFIDRAEVVVFGSGDINLIKGRLAADKLTFIYSERIYKNCRESLKYPYHLFKFGRLYGRSKNIYLLCASAFSAKDYNRLGLFYNKSFKWGYFTRIATSVDAVISQRSEDEKVRILWCARFIVLKHPELAVKLARILKNDGYNFHLDMIGNGDQFIRIKQMIDKYEVSDVVSLLGSLSNEDVYSQMRSHDIFIFTSDQNEGWGAVSNEAMSNGCVLVGSDQIGSIPYLVKDGENGMIFKSGNLKSLYEKVKYLIENPTKRKEISKKGVETILQLWSPRNAAETFHFLITELLNHREPFILEGPCSKA